MHWKSHGDCSYGKERCNFAHGEDDLIKPGDQARVARAAEAKARIAATLAPQIPTASVTPISPDMHVWIMRLFARELQMRLGCSPRGYARLYDGLDTVQPY